MTKNKNLSNSFSTGGGGARFEAHVQALYVVLMLTGGYAPCLPCWPIIKIKFQNKFDGFNIDDIIVIVEEVNSKEQRKLIGQIKRSISITRGSTMFGEVIQSAWNDFNNTKAFKKDKDIIAMITGSLSKTDVRDVQWLLEQARCTDSVGEFFRKIEPANFSSSKKKEKIKVIQYHLNAANGDKDVSDNELYEFLKHFYLLGYDLDNERGVVLSLLHSHISQFQQKYPEWAWSRVVDIVQTRNQNAGTITRENLPEDLQEVFKKKDGEHRDLKNTRWYKSILKLIGGNTWTMCQMMATRYKSILKLIGCNTWTMCQMIATKYKSILKLIGGNNLDNATDNRDEIQEHPKIDWAQHPDATYLSLVVLIGAWQDESQYDLEVIAQLLGISYDEWLKKAQEILHYPDSPLSLKNGVWKVVNRTVLWDQLGVRILDQNIDTFKSLALSVLKEPDPAFEMPAEERYMASIHGKVMKSSRVLRQGIAEGLAILGTQSEVCSKCSKRKVEATCRQVIRKLLTDADQVLWGSLNSLLPTLAEVAPGEFLDGVEKAMRMTPCPFNELFSQEGDGITGNNYLTGLLWALEGIAWDEQKLVRICVVLGELASHDPGGHWANRPSNSLVTILMHWLPQTLASVEKRKVAVQTIFQECPDIVAWNLLTQLLPSQNQISSTTHKPIWRKSIPHDWKGALRLRNTSSRYLFM